MSASTSHTSCFDSSQAQLLAESLWGLNVTSIKDLGSYIDQNFLLQTSDGFQYTLKIHDAAEHEAVLEMQNRVMEQLSGVIAGVDFPRCVNSQTGKAIENITSDQGRSHCVRLLTYVEGTILGQCASIDRNVYQQLGWIMGEMDHTLECYYHPAANRPDIPWDLKNAAQSNLHTKHISDREIRRIAEYFFLQFEIEVQPRLPELRKSVAHNDLHRYSVLVDDSDPDHLLVSGVFDFGDTVYTHTVFNIATAAADAVQENDHAIAAATELIGAYHKVFPLTELEISLLYHLICTRLSIYISNAAYQHKVDPDNDHAQMKKAAVEEALRLMIATNPDGVHAAFRIACGLEVLTEVDKQLEKQQQNRAQHFPASLYTHYEEPLYLTRGSLQYLHTADGKSYLDCVNNVCQWGHAHPYIVRALQQQASRLNTNSRYIYDVMTEYAERLTATMPDPLNVCFFVNSGSEANDLALRLARTYTGQQDVIVIDKAYHGNSTTCTEISPHRIDRPGKPGLPDHVHKVITPDTFRGPYKRDDKAAGKKYGDDVKRILDQLSQDDKGPAAFIAESLIGTGGQVVLPAGYLQTVYQHVREQGGLCIADEVQVGFGRIGSHTWCFESQQVVPDIVTMGKPMGNGHPMAAVVTTAEIAAAFDGGVTYFNTFGGNPVSCAVGLAVLDVLEQENLKHNVVTLSEQLLDGLHRLKQRFACVGDITGLGLYLGVELVIDRTSLAPATAMAAVFVERMKALGILLNSNGYDNNIIKIKPPLIINSRDIDRLLQSFEQVLLELAPEEL